MQKQSIHYISALRVLATTLVILIHASTGYLNAFKLDGFDWQYANILNSFSRFSVPLFVMVSGALLLPKEEPTTVFYRKRMTRVFYPFLFWIVVYLVYHFYKYTNFDVLPFGRIVEISIDKILHGSSAHLWFLYMLVGLYLAVPFLQKIIRLSNDREILLFIGLWIAALIVTNKELAPYAPKIDLTFFSGYIGYFVLGHYLNTRTFRISGWIYLILIIVVGSATAWGSYELSAKAHKYMPTLYYYLGLNNVLLAALVFLLFKTWISKPLPKAIQLLDNYSFGIYLVHILILNYIHPLIPLSTVWKIPAATIATVVLSFAAIYILRKLPYGKYISG